jgi:cytochrome P450
VIRACEATAALVRETLRYDPLVPVLRRVKDGATVRLDVRAANRDPEVFPDPDRFDPAAPSART